MSLALPRPSQINARVLEPGKAPSPPVVMRGGATRFLALPTEATARVRGSLRQRA